MQDNDFITVSESKPDEINSKPDQDNGQPKPTNKFTVDDLLNDFKNPTSKDQQSNSGTGANPDPGTPLPGTPLPGTADTVETRKRVIKMFWRVIDIIASIVFSIPQSIMNREMAERDQFKSTDGELKDLTEAMYDYELATGKKVATSPRTNLLMTIGVVYGDRLYMVTKDTIAAVKASKNAPDEAINENNAPDEPVKDDSKKRGGSRPGTGGARPGAGRHKNTCAFITSRRQKKCDCK